MEIELTTRDGKTSTIEVESENPEVAIREALNSPLAPEDIEEIKTLGRNDSE